MDGRKATTLWESLFVTVQHDHLDITHKKLVVVII